MTRNFIYIFCAVFILLSLSYVKNVNSSKVLQTLNKTFKSLQFLYYCSIVQKNQKLFDGTCDLDEPLFHPKLKNSIQTIQQYDGDKSIDYLIRNQLIADYSFFFEQLYAHNDTYINALNSKT